MKQPQNKKGKKQVKKGNKLIDSTYYEVTGGAELDQHKHWAHTGAQNCTYSQKNALLRRLRLIQ